MITKRPRRLRKNSTIRELVAETGLSREDFIMPAFVIPGKNKREDIASLPGIARMSSDVLIHEVEEIVHVGIKAILLFGIPEHKDGQGSHAYEMNGVVQEALRKIKDQYPDLYLITDVCLCSYTDHGHCGILKNNVVDNDTTLDILARVAVSHGEAGADMVAPSDMMDGRVGTIRTALDRDGYTDVSIMSYAVKFASNFYGPFRDIAEAKPAFGDRKSYQMDYRNTEEAVREVRLDIEEGADIVMVKPAFAYLDIIRKIRDTFSIPIAAYNVSGEYSMIDAAAKAGIVNREEAMKEILIAMKRAGARLIISYFTKELFQKELI